MTETPEGVLDRWMPEIAALSAFALMLLGWIAPGQVTTAWLGVLGLILLAYAAGVRENAGY